MEMRPYQQKGIEDIRASLRRHRRVLYQAPTGSGKGCMIAFMVRGAAARGRRICVTVHRGELVRDLSGRLETIGVPHHLITAGAKVSRAQVHVASVQSWARRIEHYSDFDFIIVDEGHHCVVGNTWGRCLDANPQAKVVAFSATPERLDGRGLANVFDDLVIGPAVRELIEAGYLAPYVAYAPADGGPDLSGIRTRAGDYDIHQLAERMSGAQLVGDAVAHYRRHADGLPAVVFCVTVEHAEAVAGMFQAGGYRSVSVDGSLPKGERRARIDGLADGSVQVLTSCELISEGLDIPGISAAILLRPTQSLGLYLQQVGRALRPKDDGGRAVILDHAGNVLRHGLPCDPRHWTLTQDRRRKPGAAPVKMCPECYAYVPAACPECPECGFKFGGGGREVPESRAGELVEIRPRFYGEDGRPIVERTRRGIEQAVAACKDFEDLKALRKALGYRSGWEVHIARGLGWREIPGRGGWPAGFVPRPSELDRALDRQLDDRLADHAA